MLLYRNNLNLILSSERAVEIAFKAKSDGQIIINGTGTVQVIDMLGRQVHSSQANSEIRISNSELTPGVYVLRLIDGSNVKSQKIVVR